MKHNIRERTMALAGVFQAASLVHQIANTGQANTAIIETSIESLFKFDTNSVEQVYGSVAGVSEGLRILRDQFSLNKNDSNHDITRYALSLLALEKKLSANTTMLDKISSALEEIQASLEFFSLMHNTIFSKLGNLYKETISTLGPRIIVSGEKPYLDNDNNANKVRALLLAGIRSAVLWRQCNGNRWQIIFGRKNYINECNKILSRM